MTLGPTYNAAADLIERNLAAGRAEKTAFIDDHGRYSYADLAGRAGRFANAVAGAAASIAKSASCFACSTASTSRPRFSARSRRGSCRSR